MVSLSTAFRTRTQAHPKPKTTRRAPVSLRAAMRSKRMDNLSQREQLGEFMRLFGDLAGARMFRAGFSLDQAFAKVDADQLAREQRALLESRAR
jgi:hypothetical protein